MNAAEESLWHCSFCSCKKIGNCYFVAFKALFPATALFAAWTCCATPGNGGNDCLWHGHQQTQCAVCCAHMPVQVTGKPVSGERQSREKSAASKLCSISQVSCLRQTVTTAAGHAWTENFSCCQVQTARIVSCKMHLIMACEMHRREQGKCYLAVLALFEVTKKAWCPSSHTFPCHEVLWACDLVRFSCC